LIQVIELSFFRSLELQGGKPIFFVHFILKGEIPEWPNGVDCKSIGDAFVGSNPALPTNLKNNKFQIPNAKNLEFEIKPN
jgi:hypothetical protein